MERAFCIFSIKVVFCSAVNSGSALIRLITSSLVASISGWLSGVGEGITSLGVALSLEEGVVLTSGEGVATGEGVDCSVDPAEDG
jgi:hypothetical protein